jgi:hypothetical protein
VPFRLFRRGGDSDKQKQPVPGAAPMAAGMPFDALTEEWRLVGVMQIQGRISDMLNRRESIPITQVSWAPIDGSSPFAPAPGLKEVDPYDLIVVSAGGDTSDDAQRIAFHMVPYDVSLEASPFRVIGTVHLLPGMEPDRLFERSTELFIPLTAAYTFIGDQQVGDSEIPLVLVNRSYLRGVEQIDRRTLEKVVPLPGRPLGGTSYRQRG